MNGNKEIKGGLEIEGDLILSKYQDGSNEESIANVTGFFARLSDGTMRAVTLDDMNLYRVFQDITAVKAATFEKEDELVYIKDLREFYFTEITGDLEDSPKYRVIEPTVVTGGIKLRKASSISYNMHRDEEGLRFDDEIGIGSITNPKEFVVGEGDSTALNMLTYTFNGSAYTDISTDAGSSNGSQFSFPNNVTGNAIYCTIAEEQNGIKYIPKGIKAKMNLAGAYSAGEIVFEYFTGLTWSALNVMAIRDEEPYYSTANVPFQSLTGKSEQIYFNIKSTLDWADTDPMSLGTAYKWFRIRVVTPVATLPVFEQFKIHTSRSEKNSNGNDQKFGNARVVKNLGWSLGDLEAANNSPANADAYASDTLGVGRVENLFQNGATDRSALNVHLPKDLDTSSPIKLRWSFITDDATAGDIRFVVRTAYTKDGDNVYRTTGAAPTVHPTQIDYINTIAAPTTANVQTTIEAEIDVSALNANPITGSLNADILWVSFERTGGDAADTHSGDIAIISFDATYISWCDGAFGGDTNLTSTSLLAEDWESGSFATNGWTTVNSVVSANEWLIGTAEAESGTNGCYISSTGGTNANYTSSTPSNVSHVYIDVAIPANALATTLNFNWLAQAEDGPADDQYDFMRVSAVTTATTPVTDTLMLAANRIGSVKYNGSGTWGSESITLPGSFIGNTVRLVFSFHADTSVENSPGACIDNVQVSYLS